MGLCELTATEAKVEPDIDEGIPSEDNLEKY
jgi:hypothetical protein